LHVSQDPRIGTGQKSGSFWERISTHFNDAKVSGKRPTRSLETKWSTIKHDVSKFAGVHSQVENLRRSGVSEGDVLSEALELYKLKHPKGHNFTFLHCWYLLRNVPRWADGSVTECRRSPRLHVHGRSCTEMPPSSEPESDCASPDPPTRQAVGKKYFRPQGNRAAKEEHKNQKIRDATIRVQLVATKELAEASKRKADILADQNVLMLFTAPDSVNLSKDSREYLHLRRQIELKKLRRQLATEEEMELREAARLQQVKTTTTAAVAADPADQDAVDHGDQGDDGDQGEVEDLWNSQIDLDEEHDANDVNIDVNDRRAAVHQLRHPNPHLDLRNVPGKSAPVVHAAILDAHTDRRRCAEVFTGRGPMTVDAIQRSPPRQPES
jgi:hypothetical protein